MWDPTNWGELSPEFALCADGMAQSPIDIRDASALDLVDIEFHYGDRAPTSIFNNGHTIQVNVDPKAAISSTTASPTSLLQFHFHSPSEHTIDGVAAPLEIHFVHKIETRQPSRWSAFMLTEGETITRAYAAVFEHLPAEVWRRRKRRRAHRSWPRSCRPARAFYTYQGSLTTPPCSEIVRWLLLDHAGGSLAEQQIAAFTAIYDGNARPVQPLGARDLLLDLQ